MLRKTKEKLSKTKTKPAEKKTKSEPQQNKKLKEKNTQAIRFASRRKPSPRSETEYANASLKGD